MLVIIGRNTVSDKLYLNNTLLNNILYLVNLIEESKL